MSADERVSPGDLTSAEAAPEDVTPELPLLAAPADGVPALIDTDPAFRAMIDALAAGSGPVAIDVERAQAYRYSAKAYLIQLRRTGSGTQLIDPLPFAEHHWTALSDTIIDAEWIIHAATQDTPSLAELGLVPATLFDTELAGRLLGRPKVGLSALIEEYFGLRLAKEHSMADWSARPLPEEWLNYAALDVELLIELREKLAADLTEAGRAEWARQEFAHLAQRAGEPPTPRVDPWRRTSGVHQLRTPEQLAVVRELWWTRDEIARRYDKAPGKILPDKAITELAGRKNLTQQSLRGVEGFRRRNAHRFETNWLQALDRALSLAPRDRPMLRLPSDTLPPPRAWERPNPDAYRRWKFTRDAINGAAERLHLPPENLITPAYWRQVCWQPPVPADVTAIAAQLATLGARPWQRELVAPVLAEALAAAAEPDRASPDDSSPQAARTDE